MKREQIEPWANDWVTHWNARDIEGVVGHFAADAVFHSPKAAVIVGKPRLEGKTELRDYWTRALARIETLHFALDHVAWDEARSEMFIVYIATIDAARTRACERLRFNAVGEVIDAEGLYGATAAP